MQKKSYTYLYVIGMSVFMSSCDNQKNADPFPYTAVMVCSPFAFKNMRIPISACMRNEFNQTTIRIKNNGNFNVLQGWQTINYPDLVQTERGIEIALTKEFEIKIQNASDELLLSMEIYDIDGNIIYKEVAEKYDKIGFTMRD